MFTYILHGRVIPERAIVQLQFEPGWIQPLRVKSPVDPSEELEVSMSISYSQLAVIVKSQLQIDDLATLRNCIAQIVRSFLDAFAYLEGRAYDVEVTSIIGHQDGEPWATLPVWTVFGVEMPGLQERKAERPASLEEIISLLLGMPLRDEVSPGLQTAASAYSLRRALADLRESIKSPDDTAFFAYRAIEGIRQFFVYEEDGSDTKQSWERMGKALRIDASWTKDLASASQFQRHGAGMAMDEDMRLQAMLRAFAVVDRFVLFVKNGFKSLPATYDVIKSE